MHRQRPLLSIATRYRFFAATSTSVVPLNASATPEVLPPRWVSSRPLTLHDWYSGSVADFLDGASRLETRTPSWSS